MLTSTELQKLYFAMGVGGQGEINPETISRSISWNRVHSLPDFVYFDHRAHVTVGVACQTCHGPVETMERMRQFEPPHGLVRELPSGGESNGDSGPARQRLHRLRDLPLLRRLSE